MNCRFDDWQRLIHVQSERHIPVLPCRDAADEAAQERQDRQSRIDCWPRAQRGVQQRLCAAKGGIIALTKKLSLELGPFGINVNAIAPSRTLTERIRPRCNQQSPEDQAAEIERMPLRRMAEASDQAKVDLLPRFV